MYVTVWVLEGGVVCFFFGGGGGLCLFCLGFFYPTIEVFTFRLRG